MYVSISSFIWLSQRFREGLPLVTEYGFDAVEIFATAKHFNVKDPATVEDAGRALRDLGLTRVSMHAPKIGVDLSSPYDEERREAIELIQCTIDVATLLSAGTVTVHPSSIEGEESDRERRWPAFRASIKELANYAGERDISLAIENHPFPLFGSDPLEMAEQIGRFDFANVGLCLDLGHAFAGKILPDVIEAVAPVLLCVQASDNRGHTDEHLMLGRGLLPWTEVLARLQAINYRGPLVTEVRDGRPVRQILEELVDFSIQRGLNGVGQLPSLT